MLLVRAQHLWLLLRPIFASQIRCKQADSLKNTRTTESLRACIGREIESMVGRLWLPSNVTEQLRAASLAMPLLHRDIAVIHNGDAFPARVQLATLLNYRGLLPQWT